MKTEDQSVGVEPPATEHDAGLDLPEIWRSLARRKLWVIGITGASIIGALLYVSSVRPEWEAVAIIQIGQLGGKESSFPVEPPPRMQARMKLASFAHDVLAGLGLDQNSREAALYERSLRIMVMTGPGLLELKVRGYSREQAAHWAEATVAQVSKVHEVLAQPFKQRLKVLLDEMNRDIQKMEVERSQLVDAPRLKRQADPGIRFAENVLYVNMLNTIERQLRDLQAQKHALEDRLSPVMTYPTSLVDRVDVPDKPTFPKKSLIIGLAGVIGLLLGSFAGLTADALRRSAIEPVGPAQLPARGDGQV